jgi:hypothetical protein
MSFVANYPSATVVSSSASVGPNGTPAPSSSTEVAGVNPGGNLTPISVDNAGNQNVNVVASVLPTGASTAANQATANTSLATITTNTTGVSTAANQATANTSLGTIATNTNVGTNGAATSALQTSGNSSLSTIATNSGTQATAANQSTGNSSLATIVTNTTGVATAALQTSGNASLTTIATNSGKAQAGRTSANAPTVTTYGTPITSAAYVTIVASTTSIANLVEIFDSSGVALYFATGGVGSEVNQFVIYPGGNGQVAFTVPAGTRISYKAVSASATGATSFNVLNLYS